MSSEFSNSPSSDNRRWQIVLVVLIIAASLACVFFSTQIALMSNPDRVIAANILPQSEVSYQFDEKGVFFAPQDPEVILLVTLDSLSLQVTVQSPLDQITPETVSQNPPINTSTPTLIKLSEEPSTTVTTTETNTVTLLPETSTPTLQTSNTATNTSLPTNTAFVSTATATPTSKFTKSTNTPTPITAASETPSKTSTNTPIHTSTPTNTKTSTPTNTETPTPSNTTTPTSTSTRTPSPTATATNTRTNTPTPTHSSTSSPTHTATDTSTPTLTHTATDTTVPTHTSTNTPIPTSTPEYIALRPVVNCKEINGDDVTVSFGYRNQNSYTVDIPIGTDNYFWPDPADRGQPTSFAPGSHNRVFEVTFKAIEIGALWSLDGNIAAGWVGSPDCPP